MCSGSTVLATATGLEPVTAGCPAPCVRSRRGQGAAWLGTLSRLLQGTEADTAPME